MNRRPWPIVLIAFLQLFSPIIYIAIAAFVYHLSFGATFNEIWALSPELRKFEIFVLPVVLGILIFLTRKPGFYVVILGTIYLIVRGIMEFIASNQTDPVLPLVLTNLICLIAIATLLRSKTRSVYFNPRLRWWETSPRFVVNLTASVTRTGGSPMKALLKDVATGGAGLETLDTGYLKNEIVSLEFQYEGDSYHLKSQIVWEKDTGAGKQFLGLQWADDNTTNDWSKLRRLLRNLKKKRTQTTRAMGNRFSDIKEWFSKLAG